MSSAALRPIRILFLAAVLCVAAMSSHAKVIGVVVLAPHNISLLQVGFMVFGNQRSETGLPAPEISDVIYQLVAQELRSEADTSSVRVSLERDELQRLGNRAYMEGNEFIPSADLGLQDQIGKLAQRCSCDELVVVSDAIYHQLKGNQPALGATLLRESDHTVFVLPFRIARIDSASLSAVKSRLELLFGGEVPYQWPEKLAPKTILSEETIRSASASLLSAQQRLRSKFHALRSALFDVGLRPSCAIAHYEVTTTPSDKWVDSPSYRAPPKLAPNADPSRCQ